MSSVPSTSRKTNHGGLDSGTMSKCRICFDAKGTELIHNQLPNSSITITAAVLKTFSFNLNSQLAFPKLICKRCLHFLIGAYVLKNKLTKTDATLRAMVDKKSKKTFQTVVPGTEEVFLISEIDDDDEAIEENQGESLSDEETSSKSDVIEIDDDSDDNEPLESEKPVKKAKSKVKPPPKKLSKRFPSNKCKNCPFHAVNEEDLAMHLETSTENCLDAYDKIECSICRKRFALQERKIEHLTFDHTNVDFRFCKYCGPRKNAHGLLDHERHMARHLKNPGEPLKRKFGISDF